MRNSCESANLPEAGLPADPLGPELELPEAPGFVSRPPYVSPEVMFQFSQARLSRFNSRPDAEALRLQEKCPVPFEL